MDSDGSAELTRARSVTVDNHRDQAGMRAEGLGDHVSTGPGEPALEEAGPDQVGRHSNWARSAGLRDSLRDPGLGR